MSTYSNGIGSEWKPIKVAASALRITNPIRDIVDQLVPPKDHPKDFLSLSIGDPTVFGNLRPPVEVVDALVQNVQSHKYDGYAHASGYASVRAAVAKSCGVEGVTADDVVLASGGSGALEMIINVLTDVGTNLLIPSPGFSLYQTLLHHRGAEPRYYKLCPEKGWEVDLAHLESLIDHNTVGILINNPSNPCGSVFSKQHLLDILAIAEKHRLPIISDEIYGPLTWGPNPFYPIAQLSANVPILSVSGLAKLYIVPGWRMGWIIIHDKPVSKGGKTYEIEEKIAKNLSGSSTSEEISSSMSSTPSPPLVTTSTINNISTNNTSNNTSNNTTNISPNNNTTTNNNTHASTRSSSAIPASVVTSRTSTSTPASPTPTPSKVESSHTAKMTLLADVRVALNKQTQLILGPSTLVQSIVETALLRTPPSYHEQLRTTLMEHANTLCNRLERVPGLTVVRPVGAMYMMLGFQPERFDEAITDDVQFAKHLLTEENLSILPGTIFTCPNFLRIVICAPAPKLLDACDRIEAFCQRHAKK